MKALTIAVLVSAVGFTAVPAIANDDEMVHGRSPFAIESALRDRGVATSGVEEWGELIRAWVPSSTGGTTMQFFDPDTLQPVIVSGR